MTFKLQFSGMDISDFIPGIYNYGMEFAPPHVDEKNNVITMCSDFSSCRELLISSHLNALKGINEYNNYRISIRDGYLLVLYNLGKNSTKALLDNCCKHTLNIVHLFEKQLGWTKSVSFDDIDAYNINTDQGLVFQPRKVRLLLIKGSKKWFKSPHMLSLYALLLRLSMTSTLYSAKTIDEFNKAADKVRLTSAADKRAQKDTTYYINNKDKIWLLLNNFEELVGNSKFRGSYHWRPSVYSYFKRHATDDDIMSEGIDVLCKGHSHAEKLSQMLDELCKQNNIKHKITIPRQWR